MRPRLVAVTVAGLLAGCGHMPHDYKVRPFPYEGFSNTFPTGLGLVAFQLSHMPEVMVSASYRVGSVDDPPGKAGMAHLIEHLTFRARPGGGARIWDRVETMGVEFNAITFRDSTEFFEVCPAAELESVLKLEADRLREPLAGISEKDFLREREVVLRELAQNRDPASARTHLDWLTERLVPGSPYATIPTAQSIGSITFDEVRTFVRAHYTPAHLLLVVTGPRPAQAVARSSMQIFGDLATGGGMADVKPVPSDPPQVAIDRPVPKDLDRHEAAIERPVLVVGWAVPGSKSTPGPEAQLAESFLRNLVTWVSMATGNRGRVGDVNTYVNRTEGVTIVSARINLLRAEDGTRIFEAIRKERRYRGGLGGVEPWEGLGLRDDLLMRAHLSLDALEQVQIASFIRTTGKADYIGEWPKLVAATLSDHDGMRAYMEKYLTDERLAGLLVVPGNAAAPVPTTLPSGLRNVVESDHHGLPEIEVPPGDPLKVARAPELANVRRSRLANGVELVVAPREGFRAVALGFYARASPSSPAEEFLRWMALEATACPTSASVDDSHVSFTARHPSDLLGEQLPWFPCKDVGPRADAPAFDSFKRAYLEFYETFEPTQQARAAAALLAALFPHHPYGDDVLLPPDRVRAFTGSDAAAFINRQIRPERTAVVVSGDVDTSPEALADLADRFAGWKARAEGEASTLAPPELPAARRILVADRPGWSTAEVVVAARVPTRAKRDEPAFRALSWKLHHDLNARLRIARGTTYGVGVELIERELAAALVLSTVVPAEATVGTLGELLGNLSGLEDPLDERALALARWEVAREVSLSFGTTARNRNRLGEIALYGLPADEWDTFIARTASLTPERLVTQAKTFALEKEIVLVSGDARTIVPALKARGLSVEVLPSPVTRKD